MVDIEKLEKEIEQQTRNGRDTVYLKVSDLKELGIEVIAEDERAFIDADFVESKLPQTPREKFLDSLKVSSAKTYLTNIDETGYHFRNIEKSK
jgi:hypothetical protein